VGLKVSHKCPCNRGCILDPAGVAYSGLPDLLVEFREEKEKEGIGTEGRLGEGKALPCLPPYTQNLVRH